MITLQPLIELEMPLTRQTLVHKDAWTIHRDLWSQYKTSGVYATALGVAEGGKQDRRDKALENSIASGLSVAALTKKDLEGIAAQSYITQFLLTLEPLALMYKTICDYVHRTNTKTSDHAKSIEWDFKVGNDKIALNLDHFRRYQALRANLPERKEFERFMRKFQSVLFSVATGNRTRAPSYDNLDFVELPHDATNEIKAVYELGKRLFSLSFHDRFHSGYAFANELPGYFWLLQTTDGAFSDHRFAGLFPPLGALEALDPQDILDLPFWRYRWQIYELWILIVALEELQRYGFVTRLSSNGKTLLEANTHALVAARETPPHGYAHYQPTYHNQKGDEVKPDLVISTAQDVADITPSNTFLVIDAKQRKELGGLEEKRRKHFEQTYAKYAAATSNCGVVILNYDTLPEQINVSASAQIFGEFHPGFPDCGAKFEEIVSPFLSNTWPLAKTQRTIVIMDMSGSMLKARPYAMSSLRSLLNVWGSGTPLYATRDQDFSVITEKDLTARFTSGELYGAECADTLCRGVLALARTTTIDHAVFITDLAGPDLSRFQQALEENKAPSWLTLLSVVESMCRSA